ncbi:DUF2459 domain-containing protein [Haliea sp. E1-2-M8]|uniref:DUF2459 domain-containing protein n=1 Tax=Haliea sp. E1-2-M8 TaxID=3064706 RepID=UPI00271D55BC|nr:DUF2459 domain-containing protein [Haliea sp. E1-2-M8]MDO8860753.1 DUF2459 domain-containing protein [Haliea sp. E1-2-M8]
MNTFTSTKLLLLLPLLAGLLSGCGATILPPTSVEQPRAVYFLQHARHSSLLLTAADSSRMRYAYGDWAWYVEGREGLYSGARALLWPSRAALGRLSLPPGQDGELLEHVIGVGIDRAHCLRLEAELVDRLLAELDAQYRAGEVPPQFNATRNLHFVRHPRAYTLLHNSNQVTASWLRDLGVQVRGNPALGGWELNASSRDAAADADFTEGARCP